MALLIFLSLSLTAFAGAEKMTCLEGQLRLRFGEKVVEEKSSYCTNKDRTVLVSKDFKKKKIKRDKKPGPYTELGGTNPGFLVCKKLGATPELLEFEVEGKWFELDRCLFPDKSYIDTGSLYKLRR